MPGLGKGSRNGNSVDLVSCLGDVRTRGYTGHFGFWFVKSKIIEDSLKRALIAEIGQIEVPKEGDFLLLALGRVHAAVLLRPWWPISDLYPLLRPVPKSSLEQVSFFSPTGAPTRAHSDRYGSNAPSQS
jgi:hypothetical protein